MRLYPVIPLRDIVVFPGVSMPLFVGRPRTLRALEALQDDKLALAVTQRDGKADNPAPDGLYSVGTIIRIDGRMDSGGSVKISATGIQRARVQAYADQGAYLSAETARLPDPPRDEAIFGANLQALSVVFARKHATEDFLALVPRMQAVLERDGLDDATRLGLLAEALA